MQQEEPTPALHLEQAMVENTRLDTPETRLKVYQELLFSDLLLALSDTEQVPENGTADASDAPTPQQLNIAILANPQGLKFAAVFTSPQAVRRWRPQGGQYATMRGQDIFKLLEPSPAEVIVVNPGSAPLIALPKAEYRQLASGIVPKSSNSPVQVPAADPNAAPSSQTPDAQNSMQISFPENVFNPEQKQHAQNILMEHNQIEAAAIGAIQPPNTPNTDSWIRTVFLRIHDMESKKDELKNFCHDVRNQIKENNTLFNECQFEVGIMPDPKFWESLHHNKVVLFDKNKTSNAPLN